MNTAPLHIQQFYGLPAHGSLARVVGQEEQAFTRGSTRRIHSAFLLGHILSSQLIVIVPNHVLSQEGDLAEH
jgi:hypothetical protein